MKANKHIKRGEEAAKFFNQRSLDRDYRHLRSFLHTGMNILDVGCGTGALSGEMAKIVGAQGSVTGIDNTEQFILSGQASFDHISNLRLVHADLFDFTPGIRFDLITSARTLQWLSDPQRALLKMKHLLKPGGQISILDYNHQDLDWEPEPPASMRKFYDCFLRWRADAGMNNRIAEDLSAMLAKAGFTSIEVLNADEHYTRERPDFKTRVGIWSQVAGSRQMVEEGYLEDELRLRAIEEYDRWVEQEASSMTMKLNEVRAVNPSDSFAITSDAPLSQLVRKHRIHSWEELCHCVQHLPYGRNSARDNFDLVLREGKGSCSSKHAFLKKVAEENDISNVDLLLGMYKMDRQNTPGIGTILEKNGLSYIPEAHCYLRINGERVDLTAPASQFARLRDAVISEIEIKPEQVIDFKVNHHREFLKHWIKAENVSYTFDAIWSIREQCLKNLSE